MNAQISLIEPMSRKRAIRATGNPVTSVCPCGPDAVCRLEAVLPIDERGQMVLPKDVRERIGVANGDKFALVSWGKDGKICCLAITKAENLTGPVRSLLEPMIHGQDWQGP